MKKKIRKLAKKAGFVFWENEHWGPGWGKIDWGCDYENEMKAFVKLLVKAAKKGKV